MKLHGSAALSQRQRRRLVLLVGSGMTIAAAATLVGCSRQTGSKWVNRHRRGEGLEYRSSRPHRSPRRVSEEVEQLVLRARHELRAGPHVVGWATGLAASTVHAILRRHGCSRLQPRQAREAIVRYQRERPGSCCTSTLRSSAGLSGPATASPATGASAAAVPAGSTCSSRSTTPAGSASPTSIRTRAPTRHSPSSLSASASTAATGCGSSAS